MILERMHDSKSLLTVVYWFPNLIYFTSFCHFLIQFSDSIWVSTSILVELVCTFSTLTEDHFRNSLFFSCSNHNARATILRILFFLRKFIQISNSVIKVLNFSLFQNLWETEVCLSDKIILLSNTWKGDKLINNPS